MNFKRRELQLIGNSIGRRQNQKPIFPRVTKTSEEANILQKSIFATSFNKKKIISDNKHKQHITKGLIEQLSTTVATTGHNTGLGWNESMRGSSRKVWNQNKIKIIDNPSYKYENKFFPKRNISSKLKYIKGFSRKGKKKVTGKCFPQGYVVTKENNMNNININITGFPKHLTGSVPSRTSSKLASSSYPKWATGSKKTYFSPGNKKTPYQQYYAHPPIYKR